jgi:hypothetical protein
MPHQIENMTMEPVLLSLTTGETLRLSPRGTSYGLRDEEVKNNPKIQKLLEQRIIALQKLQPRETFVPIEVKEGKEAPVKSGKKAESSK